MVKTVIALYVVFTSIRRVNGKKLQILPQCSKATEAIFARKQFPSKETELRCSFM